MKDEAKSLVEEEIGDPKREDKECNNWFKETKMTTEKRPANVQRRTRHWRLRPHNAQAHGEAPPSAPPARRAHQKPAPAGAARGFRPETRRSSFGSGYSPALTREPSRSLNIRDHRLAPARISGDGREGKDPVTPLPVSLAAQAPALGAAAPSGAESFAARRGGARLSFGTFQRKRGPGFRLSRPGEGEPESPPCRVPALEGHREKTTICEPGREPSRRTIFAGALILDFPASRTRQQARHNVFQQHSDHSQN
ncbi:uncharacterized protein [Kogia breviceps]|uniref:uncharacterized protein n=1 Tax=Kogia breviceps TaxID=27615 RepID=UPI0034D338DD